MPPPPMEPMSEPVGLLFPTQYHLEQKRKKELENQMMMVLGVRTIELLSVPRTDLAATDN